MFFSKIYGYVLVIIVDDFWGSARLMTEEITSLRNAFFGFKNYTG